MKVLDLFCGTKSIANAFADRGHEVFTVDWEESFEPALAADIGKLTAEDIINLCGGIPDVIWASPDCTTYSVAAISRHRRRTADKSLEPISEYACQCDETNKHLISLIKELQPKYWFIENPRAGMRKMSWMQEFPRYTVTYCKYGERRMKPTDIWTNHPDPKFKPPCKNGDTCHDAAPRGSRTGTQALANSVEKARIPKELCEHIADICEEEYRICTCCGKPMQSGYVINDGDEYFCCDDCLHGYYSEEEYDELCQEDAAYWTEWE